MIKINKQLSEQVSKYREIKRIRKQLEDLKKVSYGNVYRRKRD